LKKRIVNASIRVTAFAAMTGMSPIRMPYMSHNRTPVQKMEYMPRERSSADFVFQVFMTWGIKAIVVKVAAVNPSRRISDIRKLIL
jgi:isopentenyl diphosphate isomerase/L-lactate dehydrogenase-like FMN-dependent dehydrogenase